MSPRPPAPEWVREQLVAWQERPGFKPTLSNVFWEALCERASIVEGKTQTIVTICVPREGAA